ncbi:hypothetical protein NU688_17240 [Variovorax sp. ZS18.2.2]|uniref:hypothetical protein n=1 Tax=Variovorax sp. ZS18.2.2 TaxID=2971255 RepID=UPI002150ABA2|nr:hypothetical protein [Variovorax sp. ZS18.2.2]MCR6477911.1 hypothetical protein [Variovorax sp. ZS18.2.2]
MKPRLRPPAVPWKVSPSVPHIGLTQPGVDGIAYVTFIGFFKTAAVDAAADSVVATIPVPDAFVESSDWHGSRHRLVQLEFSSCIQVRQTPAFSDAEVVEEEGYDWSFVPSNMREHETPEDCVQRVHDLWMSKGTCPDPGMYEVEGSLWLASLGHPRNARHFLLLGHDEYLEVIASDWKWKPGQAVL